MMPGELAFIIMLIFIIVIFYIAVRIGMALDRAKENRLIESESRGNYWPEEYWPRGRIDKENPPD